MKKIIIAIFYTLLISTSIHAKYLDQTMTDIFSKVKKSFTYYGEVVAVIPERKEAVIQFENFTPQKGMEASIYRQEGPIVNKLSGKIVGQIEDRIALLSLKEVSGSIGIGDIIENKGIKVGDKVKYSKRVIFKLSDVENLSDKPLAAYNIQSYIELGMSAFSEFEIIPENVNIPPGRDEYIVNLKVFIKDSENPKSKKISVKLFSNYTKYSIGLYEETFDLSNKMINYNPEKDDSKKVASSANSSQYPSLSVYPMGNQGQVAAALPQYPYGQSPQLPNQLSNQQPPYPNAQLQKLPPETAKKYPGTAKTTASKYNMETFENTKPVITKFRNISQLSEKVKTVDFYKDKIIYSDGTSIIYGELSSDTFRKLTGDTYKGFGNIIGVRFIDVDNNGDVEIVVNILMKDSMDSRIYKINGNKISIIADHLNHIFGTFDFDDNGVEEFASQSFDSENIFGSTLSKINLKGDKIERVKDTWIPFGFRLSSSVKADLDGDGVKEILFVNEIHKLMVYQKGEAIYNGDESLGGTFNSASVNLGTEKFEYNKQKAIDVKPLKFTKDASGKESVLIVKNYATLDAVLGDVGLFKEGELRLVYKNSMGDVTMKPYTGKLEGGIEGFYLNNDEIYCAVIKKSSVNPLAIKAASYIVGFPAY